MIPSGSLRIEPSLASPSRPLSEHYPRYSIGLSSTPNLGVLTFAQFNSLHNIFYTPMNTHSQSAKASKTAILLNALQHERPKALEGITWVRDRKQHAQQPDLHAHSGGFGQSMRMLPRFRARPTQRFGCASYRSASTSLHAPLLSENRASSMAMAKPPESEPRA